jgi:hypothetical protein
MMAETISLSDVGGKMAEMGVSITIGHDALTFSREIDGKTYTLGMGLDQVAKPQCWQAMSHCMEFCING